MKEIQSMFFLSQEIQLFWRAAVLLTYSIGVHICLLPTSAHWNGMYTCCQRDDICHMEFCKLMPTEMYWRENWCVTTTGSKLTPPPSCTVRVMVMTESATEPHKSNCWMSKAISHQTDNFEICALEMSQLWLWDIFEWWMYRIPAS